MDYIQRLNILRMDKGVSIRQLSFICGLSEPSVKKIMAKKCSPKISSIDKICIALGVSLAQLFQATDEIIVKNSRETVALIAACEPLSVVAKNHLLWIANNIIES